MSSLWRCAFVHAECFHPDNRRRCGGKKTYPLPTSARRYKRCTTLGYSLPSRQDRDKDQATLRGPRARPPIHNRPSGSPETTPSSPVRGLEPEAGRLFRPPKDNPLDQAYHRQIISNFFLLELHGRKLAMLLAGCGNTPASSVSSPIFLQNGSITELGHAHEHSFAARG